MNRVLRMTLGAGMLLALPLISSCAHKHAPAPAPVTAPPQASTTPVPTPTPQPQPPAPAPPPPAFSAADLQPVFFEFDSAALTEQGRATLDQNAKLLRDHAGMSLVIEGHCDERGTSEYNQALGEKRAQAARDYLVGAGVAPSRLSVVSYGKERPFDAGHDEGAWAKNRRAHFTTKA